MTRRIISALLALILCCSLALSVSAKERNINFVYDELGYLTPEESTALSDFAWEIYQETGVGVFFSYLATEDIDTIDTRFFVKGITNYVLMVENETHWYMYLGGKCEEIDLDTEAALRAVYDETETYSEGIMAFMEAVGELFPGTDDAAQQMPSNDGEGVGSNADIKEISFVADEIGYLADAEVDLLNKQAAAIYEECGVGIFFVYTTADELENYDIETLLGGIQDYVIMLENADSWFTFYGGKGEEIDLATEERLRSVYDRADTYIGGVSDFQDAAADCFAPVADTPEAEKYFLYDEADLLTDGEEAALEKKLADVSGTYNAQIVVCTIASMDGADIDRYLDYLYDTMDFGYGENHDGVLLLVCMDPREYRILSNGFAGVAIDSDAIDTMGDAFVSDLSDGNYAAAFTQFADQCVYYLDGHLNGFPFNFGKNLMISLVIGIAVGLIVAFILKGQLKTVRKQDQANVYVKQNSMNLTHQSDIYLYRTVSRSKKSSSGSSSGGGSARSTGGGSF